MEIALGLLYSELRDIKESIKSLPYLFNKQSLEKRKKIIEDAITELEELKNKIKEQK